MAEKVARNRARRRLVVAFSFAAVVSFGSALAQETRAQQALAQETSNSATSDESESPTEEVVVSGEQPGPGLWKVSHGTHVMWILGTLSPSPKNMTWRSRQVESVIASAKQILGGEDIKANIGFFRAVRLLPSVLRARFNPDGAVLEDLIEPAVYVRWLPLRKKYFRDDKDIEKVRPMFIAFQLYAKAISESGLTSRSPTANVVRKAAKKYDVEVTRTRVRYDIEDPRQAIRDFTETPREADVACFVAAIDRLESDVDAMRQRANAWAVGDVEALKQLPVPVQEAACRDAVTSAPGLQDELSSLQERVLTTWLTEAESALSANDVTLAILPMSEILEEDGRLAKLRERGYVIEPPTG